MTTLVKFENVYFNSNDKNTYLKFWFSQTDKYVSLNRSWNIFSNSTQTYNKCHTPKNNDTNTLQQNYEKLILYVAALCWNCRKINSYIQIIYFE